jgi:hypothetical protein
MSTKAGPTGKNPFEMAPRTPGSLGVNDAASPGAPIALRGDTPGSLGVNDHAAPIGNAKRPPDSQPKGGWGEFLDSVCDWDSLSIPGAPIAFNWFGHRDITDKSVADFRTNDLSGLLPPDKSGVRQRLLSVLSDLSGEGGFGEVQWTDITLRQYTDDREQSTHFMAVKGQSLPAAYKAGMAKIFGPVDEAIALFRDPLGDVKKIATKLGNGIHPLQDSFSETHCKREERGDGSAIVGIFVWEDQDKKVHEAGDLKWQNSGGGLSAIGDTAADATKMILAYFVLGAVGKREDAARKKVDLIGKYLVASGPVAGR